MRFPHPADECLRRIGAATSSRGFRWYLSPRTALLPDPQFRGKVSPPGLAIARFPETLGRNSFYAVLTGQLEPVPGGTSELRGAVGLARPVAFLLPVTVICGGIILLAGFSGGVASLLTGHVADGVPFVLIPLLLVALEGLLIRWGMKNVQRDAVKLVEEVCCLLDGDEVGPAGSPPLGS